jgi:hypothetical protein
MIITEVIMDAQKVAPPRILPGQELLVGWAEGVGFEPTMRLAPHSGFQDRRHRPLGEPSRLRVGRDRGHITLWSVTGPQIQQPGLREQPGRLKPLISLSSTLSDAVCLAWPGPEDR